MGANQSIEKHVPNEFEDEGQEKSVPKVSHYHKTRLHNFHDDYYQNESNSKAISDIFESDIFQPPKSPNGSIYSSTNDQLDLEKPKEDLIQSKKKLTNTLEVYDVGRNSVASNRDVEVLSMHSGGSRDGIKKLWIEKNQTSGVTKTYFWESLPLNVAYRIVEYCIDDLSILLRVNKNWSHRIKNILYFKSSLLVNRFKNRYHKQLTLIDHKATLKKIKINKTGKNKIEANKLEIMMECRVEAALVSQTVSLCFKHRVDHKPHTDLYSNYVFDVIEKKEKKTVWISQEQRKVDNGVIHRMTRLLWYTGTPRPSRCE